MMFEMNSSQLNEIWLMAMDTLLHSRLEKLDYDKTVKGVIIQDRGHGVYLIEQDGVIKFDAHTKDNASYKIGDEVYILIPRNDYTSSKVIVGKSKIETSNSIIDYVSPLDSIVAHINLTEEVYNNSFGIQANGNSNTAQLQLLYTIDLTNTSLKYNHIHDTLGLSVYFKTLFSKVDMVQGNYGILLRLVTASGQVKDALFDSSEMFGDPYNYMTYFQQSKLFNISKIEEDIAYIGIYLYEQGNFKQQKNNEIVQYQPKYINENEKVNDILASGIQVMIGDNLVSIADNTFTLKVKDEKGSALSYNQNDEKIIESFWYNKTEANEYIGFTDGVVDTDYDEEEYNNIVATEWGGAQYINAEDVPPLKESLQMYANTKSIKEILLLLYGYGSEIRIIINNLSEYFTNCFPDEALLTRLNQLNSNVETYVTNLMLATLDDQQQDVFPIHQQIFTYLKSLNEEYLFLIGENETEIDHPIFDSQITKDIQALQDEWNKLNKAIDAEFNSLANDNNIKQADAYGSIASYCNRQQRIWRQVQEKKITQYTHLNDLTASNTKLIELLDQRFAEKNFITFSEEYEIFRKNNTNKYCIYWYRYNIKSSGDIWSGTGWEKLTWENIDPQPGMPAVQDDGLQYEAVAKNPAIIQLTSSDKTEQIKAILIFNHTAYPSNILEFKNITPNITDALPEDTIQIIHGEYSQDDFQNYSTNFQLINGTDALIKRQVIMEYIPIDKNQKVEEILNESTIYWYIPRQSSMLQYSAKDLGTFGFACLSEVINNLSEDNEDERNYYTSYQRQGFECFFKTINNYTTDRVFFYSIQNNYQQSAVLNTIYCKVEIATNTYEASKSFLFSVGGTSGTQYSLFMAPATTSQKAIEQFETSFKPLYLEIGLSDHVGNIIKNGPAIDVSWLIDGDGESASWTPTIEKVETIDGVNKKEGCSYFAFSRNVDFNKCLYNMCVAEVHQADSEISDKVLTLKSYYPIPLSLGSYYLDGPTTVIYDAAGMSTPAYLKRPYKLFNFKDHTEIDNVSWEIQHYDKSGKMLNETTKDYEKIIIYLPSLMKITTETISNIYPEPGTYLRPIGMFVSNVEFYSVVVAKRGGHIVYSQPLYIGQNQWDSSLLNAWDEKLTFDEKNGIILSTMVGAGYKDDENRFHGVLMGDVGASADVSDVHTGVGLYGFHDGVQSFGLNVDGTAFFGKSGSGRIEFNGNKGVIQSASYNETNGNQGMCIDLDDGYIHMISTGTDAFSIKINSKPSSENDPGFIITTPNPNKKDVALIKISQKDYYLQTENFVSETNGTPGQGMKIDLAGSKMEAYNFKFKSKNVLIDCTKENGPYFEVKDDDGKILMHVANSNYYLQTANYVQGSEGTRIDLKNGTMTSSSFSLVAKGINNRHLILKSDPSNNSNSYYIDVGDDNSYIKFTGNGQLNIRATDFYLQSHGLTINTIDKSQNPLSIGNGKFTVSSGGILSATGASVSGTITATTLTATESGTIGGWTINENQGLYRPGNNKSYYWGVLEDGIGTCNSGGTYILAGMMQHPRYPQNSIYITQGDGGVIDLNNTLVIGSTSENTFPATLLINDNDIRFSRATRWLCDNYTVTSTVLEDFFRWLSEMDSTYKSKYFPPESFTTEYNFLCADGKSTQTLKFLNGFLISQGE